MSAPVDIITQSIIGAAAGAVTGSGLSPGREQFRATYEKNAIILFGGIAGSSYTNSLQISQLAGGLDLTFVPRVGAVAISNAVAQYPFANQAIAANAIIQQPLKISMTLICPATAGGAIGYLSKNQAFSALISSLSRHNNLGGLYGVWTPALVYQNCLLTDMYDISDGSSHQVQWQWQMDFLQPLITLQAAQAAQSTLMNTLTQQLPIMGTPSYSGPTTGNPAGNQDTANTSLVPPSSVQ